ncbi:probable membrane-associated kinase regulator 2 isoform X1 [Vigna radiata var. radiata]|uniref:Probable membrane-associated kinase regulator 2 isoform X1 n=1 Tax=Vigna radiata var. radiata TaxID=3916 RepID=A0A1S3VPN1_VIGRR|nr:probable membrane-associated kinase regulator 2 isoform X1 [Vigna radiata var. radiata]
MEAFTLLKYWRGGGALGIPPSSDTPSSRAAPTTTILAAVENENATESDEDNDDDGPFFDLEFTVPDEEANENTNGNNTREDGEDEDEDEEEDINIEESDGEREFKFTLSPSSNDRSDPNLSLSPSEDLFFKGKLLHVDPSSFSSEPNSKPQFTASLLKSATKFRVFMLGLKKPKPTDKDKDSNATTNNNVSDSANPEAHKDKKHFTVKFKVEEVPIVSLFTSKGNNKTQKHTSNEQPPPSEEKRFTKEVVQKYFKMVKPLYVRVSRRYADKLTLNSAAKSPLPTPTPEPEPVVAAAAAETHLKTTQTQKLSAGLSVVCKQLGKSRSASSAVAAAPPPFVSSKRRDDSLLQQQDGIQGAILHCKRSFNASRAECESSQLPRSVSHPSHEISMNEGNEKRLST